jgi:hypothetical protein
MHSINSHTKYILTSGMRKEQGSSSKRQLRMESEEKTVVNLKVITQKWSCNS